MRYFYTIILMLVVMAVFSQDEVGNKGDRIKTGWNLGGLPAVSYNTDLGFQYGVLLNLFHYGDGSIYPKYRHNFYAEVSRHTKGSGINRFFYDSKYLIPNVRVTADVSYLPDKMYDFYGFNGYQAVYNASWCDSQSPEYRSRAFYKYDRKLLRFTSDFQGKFKDGGFGWVAGLGLYGYKIDTVDITSLNKGKSSNTLPAVGGGLLQRYSDWGIISPNERDGGLVTYVKAGLVYDSRDNEPNPMHGVWTEAVINYAPPVLGTAGELSHAKLSVIHRQYFTLIRDRLSFVYRVGYQGTLWGKCPFYAQTNIATLFLSGVTNEGLGGSKNLRGVLRNRIVGDGIVYGNFELRWKFWKFYFLKQNFYLSLNAFVDGGRVVQPVKFDRDAAIEAALLSEPSATANDYFASEERLHASAGCGLRIVMNQNFVIAADYGSAFSKQDGSSGIYIGLNFLF